MLRATLVAAAASAAVASARRPRRRRWRRLRGDAGSTDASSGCCRRPARPSGGCANAAASARSSRCAPPRRPRHRAAAPAPARAIRRRAVALLVERALQAAAVRVGRDARHEVSHELADGSGGVRRRDARQRVRRRRWPRLRSELARRRRRDQRCQRLERGVRAQPRLVGVAARRDHKAADELGIARRRHPHHRLERESGFERLALRLLRAPRRREAGGEASHAVVVKGSSRVGRCMQM